MRITGERLREFYKLDVKQGRYREDGKWYHHLDRFPGVLFDAFGYVVFNSEEDYLNCGSFQHGQDLHVVGNGISDMPSYSKVDPSPKASFSATAG